MSEDKNARLYSWQWFVVIVLAIAVYYFTRDHYLEKVRQDVEKVKAKERIKHEEKTKRTEARGELIRDVLPWAKDR